MAKTLPSVPVHEGSKFTWTGIVGSLDLSDIIDEAGFSGRLYADACDVGFYVRSERTGKLVLFTEFMVERRENEIVAWHYESTDGQFKIIVWND